MGMHGMLVSGVRTNCIRALMLFFGVQNTVMHRQSSWIAHLDEVHRRSLVAHIFQRELCVLRSLRCAWRCAHFILICFLCAFSYAFRMHWKGRDEPRDNNNRDDNDDANDGGEATSTLRVHNRNENRNTLNESMHIERRASGWARCVWVNGYTYTRVCLHTLNFVIRKLLLITSLEFKLYALGPVFSFTRTLKNYYMLARSESLPSQFQWIRQSFVLFVHILPNQQFRSK